MDIVISKPQIKCIALSYSYWHTADFPKRSIWFISVISHIHKGKRSVYITSNMVLTCIKSKTLSLNQNGIYKYWNWPRTPLHSHPIDIAWNAWSPQKSESLVTDQKKCAKTPAYPESREWPRCKFYRHPLHRMLSQGQPTVPSVPGVSDG